MKASPLFDTEAALCAAFIAWAARYGWVAYQEWADWDVLLVSSGGVQLGIEAKLTLNMKVLLQTLPERWAWRDTGPDYRAVLVGSGAKMVLLTPCARALFVWRKFISDDGQTGLNCAVFRNEGAGLSSALIQAAEAHAESHAKSIWHGERHYTYVNPRKLIGGGNPGYCFIKAGWRKCGVTKHNKLLIFERLPREQKQ